MMRTSRPLLAAGLAFGVVFAAGCSTESGSRTADTSELSSTAAPVTVAVTAAPTTDVPAITVASTDAPTTTVDDIDYLNRVYPYSFDGGDTPSVDITFVNGETVIPGERVYSDREVTGRVVAHVTFDTGEHLVFIDYSSVVSIGDPLRKVFSTHAILLNADGTVADATTRASSGFVSATLDDRNRVKFTWNENYGDELENYTFILVVATGEIGASAT